MMFVLCFLFFKQKTAYELRISDWSSDVCSSDLQRAAQAVADRVHVALTGRLFDRVERRQRPLVHVVDEVLPGEPLVRVDPGYDEHRVALVERPFDERILRLEIEDVELVDPWRDDQQRPLVDLLRRRFVLQALHALVLVDYLAGGDRK